jgi:hypothetical protein
MNSKKLLELVFSIFHDGTITNFSGNEDELVLTIDCQYLAKRIHPSFEHFFVKLVEIKILKLEIWNEISSEIKTTISAVFETEIGILHAKVENDSVMIFCEILSANNKWKNGCMHISCGDLFIYDQKKCLLSIEELAKTGTEYWNEKGK